jgi:hypothetical protein
MAPWAPAHRRRLAAVGAMHVLRGIPQSAATAWWVFYAERERGFSPARIALFVIVAYGMGTFGYLACGRCMERFGRRPTALGGAAASAAKTDTFVGERYRRLVRRRGKPKALVAVARSILVITWHLLADPTARFNDLGSDFYDQHLHKDRKTRNLIHQLQALGHQVTLTPAA